MENLSPDSLRLIFSRLSWYSIICLMEVAIELHNFKVLKACLEFVDLQMGLIELVLDPKQAPVLEWLILNRFCDLSDTSVCTSAVCNRNADILKRLRAVGFAWNHETAHVAARCGHVEHLTWLLENGCPWRGETYALVIKENLPIDLKLFSSKKCRGSLKF